MSRRATSSSWRWGCGCTPKPGDGYVAGASFMICDECGRLAETAGAASDVFTIPVVDGGRALRFRAQMRRRR